jgi:hypothetical protein
MTIINTIDQLMKKVAGQTLRGSTISHNEIKQFTCSFSPSPLSFSPIPPPTANDTHIHTHIMHKYTSKMQRSLDCPALVINQAQTRKAPQEEADDEDEETKKKRAHKTHANTS